MYITGSGPLETGSSSSSSSSLASPSTTPCIETATPTIQVPGSTKDREEDGASGNYFFLKSLAIGNFLLSIFGMGSGTGQIWKNQFFLNSSAELLV